MGARALLLLSIPALALVAGCSAAYPEGRLACASDTECPAGWHCNAGRCFSHESSMDAGGADAPGADVGKDAPTGVDTSVDASSDAFLALPDTGGDDAFVEDTGMDAAADDAFVPPPDVGIDAFVPPPDVGTDAFVPPPDMGTDAFVPPRDMGTDATAPNDAWTPPLDAPMCSTSSQCDDGIFCDGIEQCSGGRCVAGSAPCAAGTSCDEALHTCCHDDDGDGVFAPPCGNDCNDALASVGACTGATTCCAGQCRSLSSDTANCGTCGHTCAAGFSCCAGSCTSTVGDPFNCGGCGVACGFARSCCGTQCSDTSSDPMNCGSCGSPCPAGDVCSASTCACTGAMCGTTCLPHTTTNCACALQCQLPHAMMVNCTAGLCQIAACDSGWANSNGVQSDGCECPTSCSAAGYACGPLAFAGCTALDCGPCTPPDFCDPSTHQCHP